MRLVNSKLKNDAFRASRRRAKRQAHSALRSSFSASRSDAVEFRLQRKEGPEEWSALIITIHGQRSPWRLFMNHVIDLIVEGLFFCVLDV